MKIISTQSKIHLLSLISTLLVSRIALWLTWQESWMASMEQDAWHHSYTGALLLIATLVIFRKYPKVSALLTGISVGLIFDEITTPLCWVNIHIEYWHPLSWGSAITITTSYLVWYYHKYLHHK